MYAIVSKIVYMLNTGDQHPNPEFDIHDKIYLHGNYT